MADLLDILRISDSLDDINGENIDPEHTDYGMHYTYLYIGMPGEKFVDKMNANLQATDAQFLAHHNALKVRIVSNQIKEIKVENGITYYTLDDEDVEERTWHTLQGEWGKIGGTLSNQTDLQEALNGKASQDDFLVLESTVSDNYTEFQGLLEDFEDLADVVGAIDNQVNNVSTGILVRLNTIENTLADKISSEQVLAIRETDSHSLEYTTDGTTWNPVSTAGIIEWGDILGDIENQPDLLLLISQIYDAIDGVEEDLGDDLGAHTDDTDNPHNVTAQQIGLGNVDNTSDLDKPLSTLQKQYVDDEIEDLKDDLEGEIQQVEGLVTDLKIKNMTQAQYEALTTKDANTLYFINDI